MSPLDVPTLCRIDSGRPLTRTLLAAAHDQVMASQAWLGTPPRQGYRVARLASNDGESVAERGDLPCRGSVEFAPVEPTVSIVSFWNHDEQRPPQLERPHFGVDRSLPSNSAPLGRFTDFS